MSGCFEDSVITLEDRGRPGGLVVACLSPSIPKMVLEIDYEEDIALIKIPSTYSKLASYRFVINQKVLALSLARWILGNLTP